MLFSFFALIDAFVEERKIVGIREHLYRLDFRNLMHWERKASPPPSTVTGKWFLNTNTGPQDARNSWSLTSQIVRQENQKTWENGIACSFSWFWSSVCFLPYHASYCFWFPFINDSGLDEQTMVPSAAAPGSTVANIFGFQSDELCQVTELPDPGSSDRGLKSSAPRGTPVSCLHLLHCLCTWDLPPINCAISGNWDNFCQDLPGAQTPADAI